MGSVDKEGIVEQVEKFNFEEQCLEADPITIYTVLSLDPVSKCVFKYISLAERQHLRTVSHFFDRLVSEQHVKIDKMKVEVERNKLKITIEDLVIVYTDTVSSMYYGTKIKFVDGCPQDLLVNNLRLLFKNKSTKVAELLIEDNFGNELWPPNFEKKWRMDVLKTHISLYINRDLRRNLSILNHKCIQEIWIDCLDDKQRTAFDAEFLAQWKLQWRMARVLISKMAFHTKGIVQSFGHFEYVHIVVQNTRISLTVLEKLKDTLLLRPTLQKFEIVPTRKHYALDPLFIIPPKSFKPFQDPNNPEKFNFPYLRSPDVLTLEFSYDGIFFKGPAYSGDKDVKKEVPRQEIFEDLVEDDSMYNETPYTFS